MPSTTDNCDSYPPDIELVSDDDRIGTYAHYFGTTTSTCAVAVDGLNSIDLLFRPPPALLATDRRFEIVTPEPAEISIGLQLDPGPATDVFAAQQSELAAPSHDDRYLVELPGDGCYLATIGWRTADANGQFLAEIETTEGACGRSGE